MPDAATPEGAPAPSSLEDVLAIIGDDDGADAAATRADDDLADPGAPDGATPTPGEQDTATDPEAGGDEAPPTFRVKVRGEEREVTLPELLNGYSRTEDYKAKTAETAEQRRAADAARAEFTARAQRMDALLATMPHDPVLAEAQKTDWVKLAQDDPARAVQLRMEVEARQSYWAEVQAHQQAAHREAMREHLSRANETLAERLPEWRDEGKRQELVRGVTEALGSYGYTAQELSTLADPRAILVAADAMRWRQHKAREADLAAKRVALPPQKVIRPGASGDGGGAPANERALLNKAMTASSSDARLDAVMALLGD